MAGAARCPGGRLTRCRSRLRGWDQPTSPFSSLPSHGRRPLPSFDSTTFVHERTLSRDDKREGRSGRRELPVTASLLSLHPLPTSSSVPPLAWLPVPRPVRRPHHTWPTTPADAWMGDRMRRPCGKFSYAQPSSSDCDRLAEAAALQETLISFQRDCEEWCPSPHCFVH